MSVVNDKLVNQLDSLVRTEDVDSIVRLLRERQPSDNSRLPIATLMCIGKLFSKHKRNDDFLSLLELRAEKVAFDPHVAGLVGSRLHKAGRFREAFPLLSLAADRMPASEEIFHRAVKCAKKIGAHREAREIIHRWFRALPDSQAAAREYGIVESLAPRPKRPSIQPSEQKPRLLSDKALKELHDGGQIKDALIALEARIAAAPNNLNLLRRKAKWLSQSGDTEKLEQTLQLLAQADDTIGGLEALVRLKKMRAARSSSQDRAAVLLLQARVNASEARLAAKIEDLCDKLQLYLLSENGPAILKLLADHNKVERPRLSAKLTDAILKLITDESSLREFFRLVDLDLVSFEGTPQQLSRLASSLLKVGLFAEAREALAKVAPMVPPSNPLFEGRLRCAEALGLDREADRILEEWQAALPESVIATRHRLRIARQSGDADRVQAAARLLSEHEEGTARDWEALTNVALSEGGERAALDLVAKGLDRFPFDSGLLALAGAVASRVAETETAAEYYERERLVRELGRDLCETVGFRWIAAIGGRKGVHDAVVDLAADQTSVSGLLDLARICLSSLKILIATRGGERREAKELAAYGAASWSTSTGRAERLCGLIRTLCVLAHQADLANPKPLEMLLEVEALWPTESISLHQMVRHLSRLASPRDRRLTDLVWRVALDRSDQELIEVARSRSQATTAASPRVHLLADIDGSTRSEDIRKRGAGEALTKAIEVSSSAFNGPLDLQISTHDDYLAGPVFGTIHAGFVVEMENGSVVAPAGSTYHTKSRGALLQTGKLAVAINHEVPEEVIDVPLLYVAGIPSHYNNYFHFLGQLLPRIHSILAEADNPELSLGIPDFSPRFVTELLTASGVDPARILRLPSDQKNIVRHLWTTNRTSHDWQARPSELAALRSALRFREGARTGQRRLFLSRPLGSTQTRGRSLVNELELAAVAAERGFEVVDSGSLSIKAQSELFSSCDVVCGPTGAALTNLLFLPEKAKVICLSPHETCRTYYPGLTLGSQTAFAWVLGSYLNSGASERFPQLPYQVPPEYLRRVL